MTKMHATTPITIDSTGTSGSHSRARRDITSRFSGSLRKFVKLLNKPEERGPEFWVVRSELADSFFELKCDGGNWKYDCMNIIQEHEKSVPLEIDLFGLCEFLCQEMHVVADEQNDHTSGTDGSDEDLISGLHKN
jgi:hypothetical protein